MNDTIRLIGRVHQKMQAAICPHEDRELLGIGVAEVLPRVGACCIEKTVRVFEEGVHSNFLSDPAAKVLAELLERKQHEIDQGFQIKFSLLEVVAGAFDPIRPNLGGNRRDFAVEFRLRPKFVARPADE